MSEGAAATLAALLEAGWTRATGRPPRPGLSFEAAGGDSLGLMELIFALEAALGSGARLPLAGNMTAAMMLDLATGAAGVSASLPVFVFPAFFGDHRLVGQLREACGPGFTLRGIDYGPWTAALGTAGGPAAMVEAAAGQIRAAPSAAPLRLIAYSAGAWPAILAASRLADEGYPIARIVLLDSAAPGARGPAVGWRRDAPDPWRGALWETVSLLRAFGDGSHRRRYGEYLARGLAAPWARPALRLWQRRAPAWVAPGSLRGWTQAFLGQELRLAAWRPWPWPPLSPALAGRVTLLRGTVTHPAAGRDYGWGKRLADLRIITLPGDHFSLLGEYLPHTGTALGAALSQPPSVPLPG
jgi:thioesterase domain-containing protein